MNNNKHIVLGIVPIIISIVFLVLYVTNYKYLPYNMYATINESFQAENNNNRPEQIQCYNMTHRFLHY